jgi:hypothetical protein
MATRTETENRREISLQLELFQFKAVNKLCPLFCNFSNTVVCVGGDRVYKGQRKFIRIGYIGINPVSSLPPI